MKDPTFNLFPEITEVLNHSLRADTQSVCALPFSLLPPRLGLIQQFRFAEPDTEPNWMARLVCQIHLADTS